jgi:hypothetical protein
MILLTYVITLMIAKIVDQLYVTVVLNLRYLGLFSLAPYPRSGVVELTRWRFGGLLSPMFLGVDQTLCGCSGVSKSQRPIVARFIHFNDLQYVLNNAYRLRNTPYVYDNNFPGKLKTGVGNFTLFRKRQNDGKRCSTHTVSH